MSTLDQLKGLFNSSLHPMNNENVSPKIMHEIWGSEEQGGMLDVEAESNGQIEEWTASQLIEACMMLSESLYEMATDPRLFEEYNPTERADAAQLSGVTKAIGFATMVMCGGDVNGITVEKVTQQ